MIPTIGVVMTCHNRKDKTLTCLKHLWNQTCWDERANFKVFLTDDGSTDQTTPAIQHQFDSVTILKGNGQLYWNGGMHLAFEKALEYSLDYYLWLNDDTYLFPDAVASLLDTYEQCVSQGDNSSIIVGGIQSPHEAVCTYGAYKRISSWTLRMVRIFPSTTPTLCTTHPGNCVLIPKSVVEKIGNIEAFYSHRWGDTDYGLRAQKAGCSVWLAPGFQGTCPANPSSEKWRDANLSISERIKDFNSIKGYHKKDWFFYVKRHGGYLWPLLWMKPYWDIFVSGILVKFNLKS